MTTIAVDEGARAMVLHAATQEITRRGGETSIKGRFGTVALKVLDVADGIALVGASGSRAYGRTRPARWADLRYLVGYEDGGVWAVRVVGTVDTVSAALYKLTPREVHAAAEAGRKVCRQGDVYAIETTRRYDGRGVDDLPASHRWDPQVRTLTHVPEDGRAHARLSLPTPVRFVLQSTTGMRRGSGRGRGD